MRTVTDLAPRIPWRGAVAFTLSNLLPLMAYAAIVIGAFHLPGLWGQVGGWIAAGAAGLVSHWQFQDEIASLSAQAKADRIDRQRERATVRRMRPVSA